MSRVSRLALFVLVALLLVACSGGTATQSSSAGNAPNGDKLFHQATLGKDNVPGCGTCHSTKEEETLVGPSLAEIGADAAGAFNESGYKGTAKDAAGWVQEQIVNPNLEVVEGFQPNVMPQNYGTELSQQEMNDIVAYLLTLK